MALSVYEFVAQTDAVAPMERTQRLGYRQTSSFDPLLALDGVLALLVALGAALWWGHEASLAIGLALVWPLACAVAGAYKRPSLQPMALGAGTRAVMVVAGVVLAGAGALSYASGAVLQEKTLSVVFPALLGASLLVRALAWMKTTRSPASSARRVLVVGDELSVRHASARLVKKTSPAVVVAGLTDTITSKDPLLDHGAPLLQGLGRIISAVDLVRADTVMVAGGALTEATVQQLAWKLEHRNVDLALVPTMADTSADRLHAQVHQGMPLLWVRQPARQGPPALLKHSLDRVLAAVIVVTIAPVVVLIAAAVRISSKGPAVFSQTRIGKEGRPFIMYKFRTMVTDAEDQREIFLACMFTAAADAAASSA